MRIRGRRIDPSSRNIESQATLENSIPRIASSLWKKKARNILVLDVRKLVYYADFVIIASGSSDRHVKSLYKELLKEEDSFGLGKPQTEGGELGRWVLLDYSTVIIHLFFEPLRDFYELERMWAEAPVVKLNLENTSSSSQENSFED